MQTVMECGQWTLRRRVLPQHTDHAGVMWHGAYLAWLEEARVEALAGVGLAYGGLSRRGLELPVVAMTIQYLQPLRHGDLVDVVSQVLPRKGLKLTWHSRFLSAEAGLAAEARPDNSAPTPVPPLDLTAAAFFDVDNTLVQGSSLVHFGRGLAARKYFRYAEVWKFVYAQAKFQLTGRENSDDVAAGRRKALSFIEGRSTAELVGLGEEIYDEMVAMHVAMLQQWSALDAPAQGGQPAGRFAAQDDVAGRRFFHFDPVAIGAALGVPGMARYGLVLLGPPGSLPEPSQTLPRPRNNHLGYAITWYGLALSLIGVFVAFAWRNRKKT